MRIRSARTGLLIRAGLVPFAVMSAAAVVFAFPAVVSAAPTSGAVGEGVAASRPVVGADGVIGYSAQNPRATHVVLKGARVPGGCTFTATGKGSASRSAATAVRGTVVRQVETAYDPATCTSYIDQLAVPAAQQPLTTTPSVVGGGARVAGSRAASARPAVSPLVARCTNPFRNTSSSFLDDACIHSWFQDASGFHVNDVRNEVQWNPSGGCASSGFASTSYYWTEQAGWFNTLDRFASTYACSGVTSQTSESFQNNTYCSGSALSTTYDPGFITGHADNSYNWSVTWRKVGSCQSLLAFGLLDET